MVLNINVAKNHQLEQVVLCLLTKQISLKNSSQLLHDLLTRNVSQNIFLH